MWLITERGWHAAQDKCYFCIATHFDNPRLLVTSPVLCHSSNRSWGQNQSYNFLFQEYDRCRMQTKGMAQQSNYNYIIALESESWEPCSWPIEERADGASGSHHIYAWVIVLCIGRAGLAVDKGKEWESLENCWVTCTSHRQTLMQGCEMYKWNTPTKAEVCPLWLEK